MNMNTSATNESVKLFGFPMADGELEIANKIVHVLSIYPIISPTMLQASLGPGLGPKLWRPVLDKLVEWGTVVPDTVNAETPSRRAQYTYSRLRLATTDKWTSAVAA